MRRLLVLAGLLLSASAAAGGQMPKYGVTVNAEKNVDFAAFKTYSWTTTQPSADKRIDARIIAAMDRELATLGMTKAASGTGDVLVSYASVGRTDVDVNAKADSTGARPQRWTGTLMAVLLEPKSRRRLLRLRIDQPIDMDPVKLDATIDGAVTALFAKYPTSRPK